jgi:LPXTG-motif cell wall-anchored protein
MTTFTGPYQDQLDDDVCLAAANVDVKPATCDAAGYVIGIDAVNATFGTATYDAGQYTIVATATGVATFAAGPGVSDDGKTKTFTGAYEAQKDCVASAAVSFGDPSCFLPGALVLGDTVHATFGVPVYDGLKYTVVATAEDGYKFAPGENVSDDGSKKTFTGNLPAPVIGPECDLPDLDIVEPTISYTQPNCFANGTYTVGGDDVQWFLNGAEIANGKYSLASGVEIELTVAPKPPHGFAPETQTTYPVSFTAPSSPCDLTTLSLPNTGGVLNGGALWLGLIALSLGAAGVVVASRRAAVKQ